MVGAVLGYRAGVNAYIQQVFASYQYLRMAITAAQPTSDYGFQLSELQFLNTNGIVINGATASLIGATNPNSAEGPDKLNDGLLSTKLFAGPGVGTIIYTYPVAITAVSYQWATGNDSPGRDPNSWTIDGSADGTAWTNLDTVFGYTPAATRQAFQPVRLLSV